jgi:hypothetical protein
VRRWLELDDHEQVPRGLGARELGIHGTCRGLLHGSRVIAARSATALDLTGARRQANTQRDPSTAREPQHVASKQTRHHDIGQWRDEAVSAQTSKSYVGDVALAWNFPLTRIAEPSPALRLSE